MNQQEIEQRRRKLMNGFWGWIIAATVMLAAAGLLGEMGQWCLFPVPIFLFLVCMFLVFVSAYGLATLTEKENEIKERERKYKKVVK